MILKRDLILIELVIVVVLIAILAVVLNQIAKAKGSKAISILTTFRPQMEIYYTKIKSQLIRMNVKLQQKLSGREKKRVEKQSN